MPQRKRRPLTTGKGTKSTPIATPGRSPRRVSSKPSEAGKVRAAKKTTSDKYRARRSSISKAKVTTGSDLRVKTLTHQQAPKKLTRSGDGAVGRSGRYGERAKVTTGRGRSGPKLPKLPSKSPKVTRGGAAGRAPMPKESAARKAARLANRAAKGYGGSAMGRVAKKLAGKALTRYSPLAMAVQEGLTARNTAKGTLTAAIKRGDYKPKKKKR